MIQSNTGLEHVYCFLFKRAVALFVRVAESWVLAIFPVHGSDSLPEHTLIELYGYGP